MSCKHLKVINETIWCGAKKKAIKEYECRNCLLKISDPKADVLESLFTDFGGLGKFGGFGNGYK